MDAPPHGSPRLHNFPLFAQPSVLLLWYNPAVKAEI